MSNSPFALFGQAPAEAAAPRTVAEAQEIVRGATGLGIVPWGGGTRQHVGYPPERYDLALSTEHLNAITEYEPADLTVTAQAGVTLAQLQRTLAEQGQWLPLDAALPERRTVGGLVAARADSLRRFACGSVRDALIGVSVINHRGEVVKGGGKVVKNVSGYDLPKLYCGSWGTLGLIVEATFKVAPLPEASATPSCPCPPSATARTCWTGCWSPSWRRHFYTCSIPRRRGPYCRRPRTPNISSSALTAPPKMWPGRWRHWAFRVCKWNLPSRCAINCATFR